MSTLSRIGGTVIIELLRFESKYLIQPVRYWRKRYGPVSALTVKYPTEPLVKAPAGVADYVYNRNPRNLERLAIAYKNEGWTLEKAGKTFYHRLVIVQSRHGVKVSCVHNSGKVVVSASSDEWCIRKFLCKSTDKSACKNIGRIFAYRCLQSGLTEMVCTYDFIFGGKFSLLKDEIEKGGVTLSEPTRLILENHKTKVKPPRPWDVVIE